MEEEKRGRGRPKKDSEKVKNHVIKIRMDDRELETLDAVAKGLKTTRARAVRAVINEAQNILKI